MMKQRMMAYLKKSGKRRKQMARKGLHTSVDKNDSEDSDEVGEQEESVTGTKTLINPIPVAMKTPSIATYKIIKQGEKGVYQIELGRWIVMNRYGMDGPEDGVREGQAKDYKLGDIMITRWIHCLNLESWMFTSVVSRENIPLSAWYDHTCCKSKLLDERMNVVA
ncbi:hypothetical protein Tco_0896940 [Tanacetum coccineum]